MLVVIAILGLLAAMLFPVFARAKESAHSMTCLSNYRQLGQALALYAGDQEDRPPTLKIPTVVGGRSLGLGWAGATYPYAKNTAVFRNLAHITLPDEGFSSGTTVSGQMSATGNGAYGSMLCAPTAWTGKGQGRFTRFATGELDNAGTDANGDDYQNERPRHREGANWLALDGHTAFALPLAISAGITAKSANDPQRSTGCAYGSKPLHFFECAEGTAVGQHKLTFSLR
ncbi:type II secretion system protein [bacterium]|nr:MAG: type II secretion system protein [bacterium]